MSVVTTVTQGAGRGALRGIERRERKKHLRYPGRGLYPFVLDVRGKWGREAHAFVQAMVGSLPKDRRAEAVRSCRRAIAVALQTGVANQIHSAGKPPDLAASVSYLNDTSHDTTTGESLEASEWEYTPEDAAAHGMLVASPTASGSPGNQAAAPGSSAAAAGG